MATVTGGNKLKGKLEEIGKRLAKPETLRVGFLAKSTYPDGTSVAMVAAIQNWGAPAAGIPPRPFFSNMIAAKKAGWPLALALNLKKTDYDATKALALVGDGIKGQLQQSIRDTNSPPLKEATIRRKGFAKPLIHSRDMLVSVDYEVR